MRDAIKAAHSRIAQYTKRCDAETLPNLQILSKSPLRTHQKTPGLPNKNDILGRASTGSFTSVDVVRTVSFSTHMALQVFERPRLRGVMNATACLIEEYSLAELQRVGILCQGSESYLQDVKVVADDHGIPFHIRMPAGLGSVGESNPCLEKVPLSVDQWRLGACQGSVVKHNVCKPIQFPLHDHMNVIQGEGTIALEFEYGLATLSQGSSILQYGRATTPDLLIADLGDGTTLSGICMAFAATKTQVIGAAPKAGFWEHASRQHTSDIPVSRSYGQKYWEGGTRTPMAAIPWATFTAPGRLSRILEVDDEQMYAASIVARERYNMCLEPHEVVPLAVAIYNPDLQKSWRECAKT